MSTKKINATRLRQNLADALDATKFEDFIIVTRRGKEEVAIIDLEKLEDLLAASDSEYLADIKEAKEQADKGDVVSFDDVFSDVL